MTWTDQVVETPLATGNTTSSFSSYGTSAELDLKPDVAAPGGQIFSTWPHQQYAGHNTIGGTSMASPHVAGSAALYLQAHPGATAEQIRTALQNTARPISFTPADLERLESTFRQGAGMIQVDKAITSATSVTPSKLSLGEGNGGSAHAHGAEQRLVRGDLRHRDRRRGSTPSRSRRRSTRSGSGSASA